MFHVHPNTCISVKLNNFDTYLLTCLQCFTPDLFYTYLFAAQSGNVSACISADVSADVSVNSL